MSIPTDLARVLDRVDLRAVVLIEGISDQCAIEQQLRHFMG